MFDYETEEQQVEAIKNWWKENGAAIISGAVLGIGALVGWRGWIWYQENLATEASDIYVIVQDAVNNNDSAAIQSQADVLRSEYKSTPYASLATLYEAKTQSEKGDLAAAAESLRWVMDHSSQDTVKNVARIRLARVLVADNKLDEAAATINHALPKSYASLINEIRGDIYLAKGENEQAKQAYNQAVKDAGGAGVEYLQMKRNDLGS